MSGPRVTVISTLRHARTVFSGEERYAGTMDVPLSDQGVQECRAAARALAGENFEVVVTSTQSRAIDTAGLLGFDSASTVQTTLCRERGFGVLEGLTAAEVRHLDPPVLFITVGGDAHSVNPEGGEPLEDVWQRARQFRDLLFHEHEGSRVLVIAHGVFLQMLHGVLRGLTCIESLADYPGTLELHSFRFEGRVLVAEDVRRLAGSAGADF